MIIEKILEVVGSVCKVSEHNGYLYIETPAIIDALSKLYKTGFKSLTDCFVTKDKQIYFQITDFLKKQTLFITGQYEKDTLDSFIVKIYPNYVAYKLEIEQYLNLP